jgi:uncharacterized protein
VEVVRDCLVMAKPAGPRCNLACAYCYYIGKEDELPRGPGRLPLDLLERFISQRLQDAPGPAVHFEWHGGEPTLLGLDYFRAVVRLQRAHSVPGKSVTNGIQTNGTLLNGAWADFLAREGFSVGLSLDGPKDSHDAFRKAPDGQGSHARAERAFTVLAERGVFTNVLCVVHGANAGAPDEIYDYYRGLGVKYLQFLPLAAGGGRDGGKAAPAAAVGAFLCRVFDRWISEDVGKMVIQNIDEALRPVHGVPHSLCIHRETCGDVAVLERDGGFYACDHFVEVEHLLGNLKDRSLAELSADPRLLTFGDAKRATLPRACRECDVLSSCNGGCPKDRLPAPPGEPGGVSRLCEAWQALFRHARPGLEHLSAYMKKGGRLGGFRLPVIAEQGKTGVIGPSDSTMVNGTGENG